MSGYFWTVQKLLYSTLNGNIAASIYDDPPDQDTGDPTHLMPYVVIGEDNADPEETDTWRGEDVTVELNFFSAYSGAKEVKELMAAAWALLHRQSFTSPGVVIVDCLLVYSNVVNTAGTRYQHGISRYTFKVREQI